MIVTSQRRLSGLTMEGAELVELRPFDNTDGMSLVTQLLPAEQVSAERNAVRDLVCLCAGLPIALRVASARLTTRRRWPVARLVDYLSDDKQRLGRLSLEGEFGVANVFDAAYAELPGSARRLYQCLGLHPGPEFDISVLAAAAKISIDKADESIDVLLDANLVEDLGSDRYRLHDLVRLHARQRAEREQKLAARQGILERIVEWYLLGAAMADRAVLGSSRWRLAQHKTKQWAMAFNPATAMDWLETERANLLEAVRCAARNRWHELVWKLCEALWAFYYSRKYHADWIETHELAVEAVRHTGNRLVEARMSNQLARAHIELREFDLAATELDSALKAAIASDERRAKAVVYESFGILYREQGEYLKAIEAFRHSRTINEESADQRGVALESYHLGDVLNRIGHHQEAETALSHALELFRQIDDDMAAGRVHIILGAVYHKQSRTADAQTALRSATTIMRERKQPVKEAQALETLIMLAQDERDIDLMRSSATRLVQVYQEAGSPRAAIVQKWLEQGERADD